MHVRLDDTVVVATGFTEPVITGLVRFADQRVTSERWVDKPLLVVNMAYMGRQEAASRSVGASIAHLFDVT